VGVVHEPVEDTAGQREKQMQNRSTMRRYTMNTVFEWDDRKNKANRRKHGVDFIDAARVPMTPNV
jgi:hypothetical protein